MQNQMTDRDTRMQWWREARYGMFIHWGLYSELAGQYHGQPINDHGPAGPLGEWIMATAGIPVEEYETIAPKFTASKYDPRAWARLAREAGVKYLVITTKHHEGFAMYKSAVSPYNIVDGSPFGRDPLPELAQACRDEGIHFGCYYSVMDWHHPSQEPDPAGKTFFDQRNMILMKPGRKEEYVTYMKAQLAEVIGNYDPEIIWFDGEWGAWWTHEDGRDLEAYLRGLKPSLIINNRVGKRGADEGDFGTPEQEIPAEGLATDWETCMTLNDTWGYRSDDHNWKPTSELVHNLVDIVSKGGNFLLNIGPTAEGEIPEPSAERLREAGAWLRVNGQAVYGCGLVNLPRPAWGRYTAAPGRLNAVIFDWPKDGKLHVPVKEAPKSVALLTASGPQALKFTQGAEGIEIELPAAAPDRLASIIVIE